MQALEYASCRPMIRAILATGLTLLCSLLTSGATAKQPMPLRVPLQVPEPPLRSATLPFNEVLELYRHKDRSEIDEEQIPPVDAIVQRLELDGRVLDKAITAKVKISIEVLADQRWVTVPILELGGNTVLEEMPNIKGAALVVVDGQLQLVAQQKGRFEFTLGLSSGAVLDGAKRAVSITFAGATLARCRVGFDPSIFELMGEVRERHGDVVTLHSRNNRCAVQWQHRDEYVAPSDVAALAPQAEPVIPTARASIVSTLEGEHIVRVAYELRFAGRKSIDIELPKGHVLLSAHLNGRPITASANEGLISLEVFAARAGQTGGELELALAARDRDYLLSGQLPLVLPRPSWRTNELYLSAHLPAAFDYTWTSGTLSPTDASPGVEYVYDIPAPGKALHFRQFLVHRSTPSLTLQYAVSLEGHYFRAEGG